MRNDVTIIGVVKTNLHPYGEDLTRSDHAIHAVRGKNRTHVSIKKLVYFDPLNHGLRNICSMISSQLWRMNGMITNL